MDLGSDLALVLAFACTPVLLNALLGPNLLSFSSKLILLALHVRNTLASIASVMRSITSSCQ